MAKFSAAHAVLRFVGSFSCLAHAAQSWPQLRFLGHPFGQSFSRLACNL